VSERSARLGVRTSVCKAHLAVETHRGGVRTRHSSRITRRSFSSMSTSVCRATPLKMIRAAVGCRVHTACRAAHASLAPHDPKSPRLEATPHEAHGSERPRLQEHGKGAVNTALMSELCQFVRAPASLSSEDGGSSGCAPALAQCIPLNSSACAPSEGKRGMGACRNSGMVHEHTVGRAAAAGGSKSRLAGSRRSRGSPLSDDGALRSSPRRVVKKAVQLTVRTHAPSLTTRLCHSAPLASAIECGFGMGRQLTCI
jgi:hypothetical protein